MRKKKRKEAPTLELSSTSRGPACGMQGGLKGGPQHKSLVCCLAQDGSEEESDTKSEKEIAVEKDTQVSK